MRALSVCRTALVLTLFTHFAFSQAKSSPSKSTPKSTPSLTSYADLPLAFESNQGQAPGEVQFLSHSDSASVEFTNTRAIFTVSSKGAVPNQSVAFAWLGAQANLKASGEQELSGRTNYLVGESRNWIRGVANYRRVRYRAIYSGVDLVYYGNYRKLEYDLEVSAGADASRIALAVEGANALVPKKDGGLLIRTDAGDMVWQKPVAYQMKGSQKIEVAAAYRVQQSKVSFELGPYDHRLPLTVDPTLAYAALIGPTQPQNYVATDSSGSAYLLTSTVTPSYPTTAGSYMPTGQFSWEPPSLYEQPFHPLLAITKFSPDGSTLVYSTYLGGSQFVCSNSDAPPPRGNFPGGIAIDASGNAIIAGSTDDTNFPVTSNAIQSTVQNCEVPYSMTVSKLSADGSALLYATYLSSSGGYANSTGVAVDSSDNIYVVGMWNGPGLTGTTNLASCTSCANMFVGKISASGSLGYSLLFGGSTDAGPYTPVLNAIAVDSSGDAYVTGTTPLSLPIVKALQPTPKGTQSAFTGEVNPAGSGFNFLTYLGGSQGAIGNGIAVDSTGNIYVDGYTFDNDFPTMNAYQSTNKAYPKSNGFVTKYAAGGQSYVYSTYIGGTNSSWLYSIAVGPDGTTFVAGSTTQGSDYPVTPDAFEAGSSTGGSVFTAFQPSGQSLAYSTYIQGTSASPVGVQAQSVAVTPDGQSAFIAGWVSNLSNSNDFPVTPGAYDNPNNGVATGAGYSVSAAFVTKFCMGCPSPANLTILSPLNGAVLTNPVNFMVKAFDPNGVAELQIYVVPGEVAYQTSASSIDKNLNLAPGNYSVVVQEWSDNGSYLKKTVDVTVQNLPPTVKISSPTAGATVSNPVHVVATARVNGKGTIVHYRVYSAQGVAVYDVSGRNLNAYVNLPQGAVNLTVVAWDSSGAAGAASVNITSNGGSGGPQVVITSPTNYAVLSSPVTFAARATTTCKAGIYALQVYTNPGVLAYTAYASSVNTSVTLSPGIYYGAVQAWDNCGGTFSSNVTFQVQ